MLIVLYGLLFFRLGEQQGFRESLMVDQVFVKCLNGKSINIDGDYYSCFWLDTKEKQKANGVIEPRPQRDRMGRD